MSQEPGSSVMRLASQSERKEHDKRTNERDSNIPNTIRRNLFTIRSCGTMRYEEFIKRLTKLIDAYDNDPWAKAEINGVCNLIYDIRNMLKEYKIK